MRIADKRYKLIKRFGAQWQMQLMVLPAIVLLFIFCYIPMAGIILAFKDFTFRGGVFGSPWVGVTHFKAFFTGPDFGKIVLNTLAINLLKLVFSFPIPIIFTLLLNEVVSKGLKRATQTVVYLPHFISWVIVAGIFTNLLTLDGTINRILTGLHILKKPVVLMGEAGLFWPLMVITGVWKEAGWNSIIFIAALSNVNTELYDAAKVDGAGRFKRMLHVTLPALSSAITICLLFSVAGIMTAGFDQIYLFQNPLNLSRSEVLDTYIYKTGIKQGLFSRSAAGGLFQSVLNFTTLIVANTVAKRVNGTGLF